MNFLQVALTTKCNLSCEYCPIAKWRNVAPKFPLCNEELIPFIEKWCVPELWVIELTGGEPALYDGLPELLAWLSNKGYTTLVKTNGMLPIAKYPKTRRCAAFHNLERPPLYFDLYLIINDEKAKDKIAYCTANRIPYRLIGRDNVPLRGQTHYFEKCAFINPAGHQVPCQAITPVTDERDGHDFLRITDRPLVLGDCCPTCKAALDAWRFL